MPFEVFHFLHNSQCSILREDSVYPFIAISKAKYFFGKSMHEVMPCYIYELNNES